MEEERFTIVDAQKYIKNHSSITQNYLSEHYSIEGQEYMRNTFFIENPIQSAIIIKDSDKNNDEKIEEFLNLIHSAEGMLIYIIGAKGSGKTCTSFFIAEQEHKSYPNRRIAYIGKKFNKGALPSWCSWYEKLQVVPNGTFGIIDELGIQASARSSTTRNNKDFSVVLQLARQKKIPLIILTQDTRMGDVNVWRLRDIILWKMSNTYGFGVRVGDKKERGFWDKVKYLMKAREKDECLIEYECKRVFIHFEHELPECWNSDLSNIYADADFSDRTEQNNREVDKGGFIVRKQRKGKGVVIIG